MPRQSFPKQLEKMNEVISTHCRETEPKKRRAEIVRLLEAKVNPDTLNSYQIFTEAGALITDPMEQERRGKMTAELRRHVLEQKMAQGTKKRKFSDLMQRTGNLYYYFKWIGFEEVAEDFDRVMTISQETREEQVLRLRAEGMTKEDAENATDIQRKQAAMARGNMLKELAAQFKNTTAESLQNVSDEEIVRLFPLFSYMNDMSLNLDDLYTSQAGDILLTDEARKLCQHLSDLMVPLRNIMGRAELIFSPYYQYLDHEKLSAKYQENREDFLEQFPEYGNNESYLGIYGIKIDQVNSQPEKQAPKKDYRKGLCEKLVERVKEAGMTGEKLSYEKPDGTKLEDSTTDLGQYLYEGEMVLVSDGTKQMEVYFRNGKPLMKKQEIPDAENGVEQNEQDLATLVHGKSLDYVNQDLKMRLDDVVGEVRKADPKWMISSSQYREMREKLKEFAEVYNCTKNDFAIKDPSMIRRQQRLLCELMTKANDYLRYKGRTSAKRSEQKRINAAKSILEFAEQRLNDLDYVEKARRKLTEMQKNAGNMKNAIAKPQNVAKKVIEEPQNEAKNEIEEPQNEAKNEIEEPQNEPKDEIEEPQNEAKNEIAEPQNELENEIEEPQNEAKNEIAEPQNEAKNEIEEPQNEPKDAIEEPQNEPKDEIEEPQNEAKNEIAEPQNELENEIEEPQNEAKNEIAEPQNEAKNEIEEPQNEPKDAIEEPQNEPKDEIEEPQNEAKNEIAEPQNELENEIEEPQNEVKNEIEEPQNEAKNEIPEPQNEEEMRKRFFNEAGRRLNHEKWRLFRENANTIDIAKQLTDAFTDDSEESIYNRLGLADSKKFDKKLKEEEKIIVGELLESAVIKQLLHSEQQNICFWNNYQGIDGSKVCGPYELLTQMRPMNCLRSIIKKTGVIDEELNNMTRLDLIEMIVEQPLELRLVRLYNKVYRKSKDAVMKEREKILAEHKELGSLGEDDPRNWVIRKQKESEKQQQRAKSRK